MGLTTECDELDPEGRDEILGCLLNGDGWRGAEGPCTAAIGRGTRGRERRTAGTKGRGLGERLRGED